MYWNAASVILFYKIALYQYAWFTKIQDANPVPTKKYIILTESLEILEHTCHWIPRFSNSRCFQSQLAFSTSSCNIDGFTQTNVVDANSKETGQPYDLYSGREISILFYPLPFSYASLPTYSIEYNIVAKIYLNLVDNVSSNLTYYIQ